MDEAHEITLLLDFYGGMLTEKQRRYLEQYYFEDFSLSEIGENEGITKQGVRELIVRTKNKLIQTEAQLGLVSRLGRATEILELIGEEIRELEGLCQGRSGEICRELRDNLQKLDDTL